MGIAGIIPLILRLGKKEERSSESEKRLSPKEQLLEDIYRRLREKPYYESELRVIFRNYGNAKQVRACLEELERRRKVKHITRDANGKITSVSKGAPTNKLIRLNDTFWYIPRY